MSIDCRKLDLQKQEDGSLKGTYSYYYERYSMFGSAFDGWREKELSFASVQDLKEHLTHSLAIRYDAGVYIDGIKLENIEEKSVSE